MANKDIHELFSDVKIEEFIANPAEKDKSSVAEYRHYSTIGNMSLIAMMVIQGYTNTQIAHKLECSRSTISRIRNSDEFKTLLNNINKQCVLMARTFLETATLKATKNLLLLMDSANEKIKLDSSIEVLNRAGVKAPDKIEISNVQNTDKLKEMSDEELLALLTDEVKSRERIIQLNKEEYSTEEGA